MRREYAGHPDLAYGDAPRERLDLFPAADPKAPTLAFIHSGYWPMNDRRVSPFSPRACSKGGTSGSNPASSTGESCANLTCTQTVLSVTYFEPVPLRVARAPRLPTHKPSMK